MQLSHVILAYLHCRFCSHAAPAPILLPLLLRFSSCSAPAPQRRVKNKNDYFNSVPVGKNDEVFGMARTWTKYELTYALHTFSLELQPGMSLLSSAGRKIATSLKSRTKLIAAAAEGEVAFSNEIWNESRDGGKRGWEIHRDEAKHLHFRKFCKKKSKFLSPSL